MTFEVVTLVSSSDEVRMLREHLLDRHLDVPITVLLRSGVELPPTDGPSVRTVTITAGGVVEQVLREYASSARAPWLLQVDPDERWPEEAFRRAAELVARLPESEAAAFPMTYFVGARPLRGGPWGAVHPQRLNSAASHARAAGEVHVPPPATRVERVPLATSIQHFWVRDLAELRVKKAIYLEREGTARLARFGAYRPGRAAVKLARAVAGCIRSAPWKDGLLGLWLAAEMVNYQWKATLAWRRADRAS